MTRMIPAAADAAGPARVDATWSGGSPPVGLLDTGRGLAATRPRVTGPGRRPLGDGMNVQTWTVGGRKATDRAGAAEYLRLAPATVNVYASPFGRARYGWPEPLAERVAGRQVFALDDLDAFAAARAEDRPRPPMQGHPDELIGVDEFAAMRGVKRNTMKRYVEDSLNAWDRGEAGYLPPPDDVEPAPIKGSVYRWRRGSAYEWSFPDLRRTSGRRPGRRPTVDDLQRVLRVLPPGPTGRPTVREIAAALTEQLGTEVSSQVVRRRLRLLDEPPTRRELP